MDTLIKVEAKAASDICGLFELEPEARALLDAGATPAEYLARLVENTRYHDAARFLAHALPKREAVWWACLCARETLAGDAPPERRAAIEAAEAWVYQPTEENRRTTMARAERAGYDNPSSWAAMAAFWSGGSMAPEGSPEVPPGATLTAIAVGGAVILAAVQHQPEHAEERFASFFTQGIDVANGGNGRPVG